MAHSLESRLPFLDHRLAELVFSLPTHLFMSAGENKHILREATRGLLPEPVRLRQDKLGFPTPQTTWIYETMCQEVRDLLESPSLAARGVFDTNTLRNRFNQEVASGTRHSASFWFRVICFEQWQRMLCDYETKTTGSRHRDPMTVVRTVN